MGDLVPAVVTRKRGSWNAAFKCDQIQEPPPGQFDSSALSWFGTKTTKAWIPECRLQNFLEGEQGRSNFNTTFYRSKREETKSETGQVEKVCSRYHCTFGPQDVRDFLPQNGDLTGARRLARGQLHLRSTTLTGSSNKRTNKRGCKCNFITTMFANRPGALMLTWCQYEHLDKSSTLCHGMLDKTAFAVRAHIAPRLSKKFKLSIERLLRAGLTVNAILDYHKQEVISSYRKEHPDVEDTHKWSRDMQLSAKDVRTINETWQRKEGDFTNDDVIAIKMWTHRNLDLVLIYRETKKESGQPFMLMWATECQIRKLATLTHDSVIALDATFGTDQYVYPLYTILAYDKFQNAFPVAWILTERWERQDMVLVLKATKRAAELKRAELGLEPWKPNCWIVDCAAKEEEAISDVFPNTSIALCIWHVQRAWSKNIACKVLCPFAKAEISQQLGELVHSKDLDFDTQSLRFMERWGDKEAGFVNYYQKEWHKKVCRWLLNFRKFERAKKNWNRALERYHGVFKVEMKRDKAVVSSRTISWLLNGTLKFENNLWCRSGQKYLGCIRNQKIEDLVWKCIHRAGAIQDEQVVMFEHKGQQIARVKSVSTEGKEHLVVNYDKKTCACTCGFSQKGNACKHQIKVFIMKDLMNGEQVHRYLGQMFGAQCVGVEFGLSVGSTVDVFPDPVADDRHLSDDDGEDIWEPDSEGLNDLPASYVEPPPLEDFLKVVRDVYEGVSVNAAFSQQALTELKQWKESLITRGAQQNDAQIEEALQVGIASNGLPATQPLSTVEGTDRSTKEKGGSKCKDGGDSTKDQQTVCGKRKPSNEEAHYSWDRPPKHRQGKCAQDNTAATQTQPKPAEGASDNDKEGPATTNEEELWAGEHAPDKLQRLPKEKVVPIQTKSVNDALEHLQALLDKGEDRKGDEPEKETDDTGIQGDMRPAGISEPHPFGKENQPLDQTTFNLNVWRNCLKS